MPNFCQISTRQAKKQQNITHAQEKLVSRKGLWVGQDTGFHKQSLQSSSFQYIQKLKKNLKKMVDQISLNVQRTTLKEDQMDILELNMKQPKLKNKVQSEKY